MLGIPVPGKLAIHNDSQGRTVPGLRVGLSIDQQFSSRNLHVLSKDTSSNLIAVVTVLGS